MRKLVILALLLILGLGVAANLNAQILVTVGDGDTTNGTSGVPTPYGTYYKNFRQQYLILASELEDLGGGAGDITSLAFNVQNVNTCSPMPNFKIRLKQTTQTALTTTFETGDYTEVFFENDFLPVEGWNTHEFTAPFVWDGGSHLLVDVVTSLIPGSYTQNASVYYSTTTFNSSLRYQSDSLEAIDATTGTISTNRSNIRFNMAELQLTDPPNPAIVYLPEDGAELVSPYTSLVWASGGGVPTGYTLSLGTNNPPSNIVSDLDLEDATSYTPDPELNTDTTYYWQIVPYNDMGDATNCPVWSFTTHGEASVNSLPYTQNWDAVTVPDLPFDWSSIHNSTTSYSYLRTSTSSPFSDPNCVQMANSSDAEAELLLISPAFDNSIDMSTVRVKLMAKGGTNYLLHVGTMSNPTDASTFVLAEELSVVSGWNEYVVNLSNHTAAGQFIALKHGLGSTYRTMYIDDVTFEEITANDLAAVSVSGNTTPSVNAATDYTVMVLNNGTASQSGYQVQLIDDDDAVLAQMTPTGDIPAGEILPITITYTPTTEGPMNLRGKVLLAGDVNDDNDISSPLAIYVQPAGITAITIGDGDELQGIPWEFFYKNSLFQTLYFENEINATGLITALSFFNNFSTDLTQTPVKIWLGTTTENDLEAGWIEPTSLTLVFDGNIDLPSGENTITVPLNSPFNYTGDNLVLYANRPIDANYYSSSDDFQAQTIGTNRARKLQSDSITYDPMAPSATGTLSGTFPKISILIDSGTAEEPVFAITPESHDFGDVDVNSTATQSFTVTNAGDGSLTINSIALSGSDMMSLTGLPTLPANLAEAESFSFNAVYSPTAAGNHSATITLRDNIAREMHTVELTGTGIDQPDTNYPPSNLQATVTGTDVHLSWNAPEPPPTGEWITWCDTASALSDGIGTDQPAVFDVAHRYDTTDLLDYQGSTLTHIQFVPNEANCTYTIKVWTGGSAAAPGAMVHSQVATDLTIGQWNTVELSSPIPIPAAAELWFGYEVDTTTGYPAGCDAGPEVAGKGNMINFNGWDELTGLNEALTYNWSIQGYVDHELDRAMMPAAIAEAPRAPQSGELSLQENPTARVAAATNSTREQLGYKLYRDDVLVATIDDPATLEYIDAALDLGTYSYTLTATYDEGESIPAGPVVVSVEELPAPTDLASTVDGNDVTLDWESPVPPLEGEWISWSDNANLGNSIGTDAAANFDVAHRYAADDLTEYVGGTLAQMKFVPMYADCVYTVKIWTGGTDTAPGTMVHSQVVDAPVIEDWTLVILNNPIPIQADQALWIGYNVNTQGGFPAGCDNGPQVEGKGNMMNLGGWTTLSQVNDALTYNWMIQGFVAQGQTLKGTSLPALTELPLPTPSGQLSNKVQTQTRNHERAVLLGYKLYRDGAVIHQISDPDLTTYVDMDLPNGDYVYGVSAVYNVGESMPATLDVTVNLELAEAILEDSFEDYADFATEFAPWTMLDQDNSATYGFSDISFPGSESAMAYIVFNPSQTVPPITDMDPYEGDKMAASFAAVEPTNDDWMITPRINLGDNSAVKFYAKSHTSNYGLERFRVGVSTMDVIIPQGFQYITGASHVEAPTNWTEYIYDLSAYDNQDVYIAIRCVSDDAFVFYVDNFSVHTDGGSSAEDPTAPMLQTELKGNYPNPFNPTTTIRYSVKEAGPVEIEIYNVKGQLVKHLMQEDKAAGEHTVIWNGNDENNQAVSTGVYFYKMNAGKYSSTRKMIMMK